MASHNGGDTQDFVNIMNLNLNAFVNHSWCSYFFSFPFYSNTSLVDTLFNHVPDSKIHGANMGPTWGRQDPGGPHVGPMNFAIWGDTAIGELLSWWGTNNDLNGARFGVVKPLVKPSPQINTYPPKQHPPNAESTGIHGNSRTSQMFSCTIFTKFNFFLPTYRC